MHTYIHFIFVFGCKILYVDSCIKAYFVSRKSPSLPRYNNIIHTHMSVNYV